MTPTQRNFLILGLIAVLGLVFTQEFSAGAAGLGGLLSLGFLVLMSWFIVVQYQKNSGTIAQMAATPRLVMQISVATLFFLVAFGTFPNPFPIVNRTLPSVFGFANDGGAVTMIFFAALFGAGYGAWWSWQQRTSRW